MARTLGDLVAVIGADTSQFETAMQGIATQLTNTATNLKAVGSQVATNATQPIAALGTTAQTAATQVSAATTQMGTAAQKATTSVAELGKAQAATTQTTQQMAAPLEAAGEKAGVMGSLFAGLKDKALELVPGLGSVLSMAGGVATGMAGLEIAQKVGGWLVDVGGKALQSSGQLGQITAIAGSVQSALEGLVGKGIQLLASAISATIGPAITQLATWITEGLQYLTAFGDWFQQTGAFQIFGAAMAGLTAMFAPLVEAVEKAWAAISAALGGFGNLFGSSESAGSVFLEILSGVFQALAAVVALVITLIKQQFTLFVDALTWVANLVGVWVPKLIGYVKTLAEGIAEWFSRIGTGIQNTFGAILTPIENVFTRLWQLIQGWATDVLSFLGKFIGSIPGLQQFAASFNSINNELLNFGRAATAGTAAQKALNDQHAAAAAQAKLLTDAQHALGVSVVDAAAAVTQSAAAMTNWRTVTEAASSSPSELAAATVAAFNSIAAARKSIEEKGTAAQKAALDAQLKQLEAYAAAHGISLAQITAQNKTAVDANQKLASTALEDLLKSIGYVSEAQASFNISRMQEGYEAGLKLMTGNTAEFAQFLTKTYDQIQTMRKQAADAGYTAEVSRLDQISAAVRKMADSNGVALQSDVNAFAAVADAVGKIPPQVSLADTVINQMGNTGLEAAARMSGAMNSLKSVTDDTANAMIQSVAGSYLAQVNIAGTSEAEKVRLAKEAYAQMSELLNQYGAGVNAETAGLVQTAMQSQLEITNQAGAQLGVRSKATKDNLDQQNAFFDVFNSNISKGMKKASQDITDALWSGDQSFGQIALSTLEDIGKGLTKTFVQTGLDAVGKFVSEALKSLVTGDGSLLGGITKLGKAFAGIFQSGGGGGGGGVGGALSAAMGQLPAAPAMGGASSAVSGLLGGLSSVTGIVSGAISAVTDIIGIFQTKGTQKIEENMQNGIFLTYYDVHSLMLEGISYFHFMEKWVPQMVIHTDSVANAINATKGGGTTTNNYNVSINATGGSLDGLIRALQAQGFVLT